MVLGRGSIESGGDSMLKITAFLFQEKVKNGKRQQEHPNVRLGGSEESDDYHLQGEERPEDQFGLQRPHVFKAAMEVLLSLVQILRHGGQTEATPAASEYFHIIIAPANISFVLPALRLQAGQDGTKKGEAVQSAIGPVGDFCADFSWMRWTEEIGQGGRAWVGTSIPAPAIASEASFDRLEQEEQRDQRPRP